MEKPLISFYLNIEDENVNVLHTEIIVIETYLFRRLYYFHPETTKS